MLKKKNYSTIFRFLLFPTILAGCDGGVIGAVSSSSSNTTQIEKLTKQDFSVTLLDYTLQDAVYANIPNSFITLGRDNGVRFYRDSSLHSEITIPLETPATHMYLDSWAENFLLFGGGKNITVTRLQSNTPKLLEFKGEHTSPISYKTLLVSPQGEAYVIPKDGSGDAVYILNLSSGEFIETAITSSNALITKYSNFFYTYDNNTLSTYEYRTNTLTLIDKTININITEECHPFTHTLEATI